jgi:hypothetical protein
MKKKKKKKNLDSTSSSDGFPLDTRMISADAPYQNVMQKESNSNQ